MSEYQDERKEMSATVNEARLLVQRVAEPRETIDSVKAAIVRAARRLGFKYGRTKDIWYGHARRIDAAEMDRLREEAARIEARLAIDNLVALRERLAQADENFHQPTIAALDDALRSMGADVRAVALPEN